MNFIKHAVLLLSLSASPLFAMEGGDNVLPAEPTAPPAHVVHAPVQEVTWYDLPEELLLNIMQHATLGSDGKDTRKALLGVDKKTRRIALDEAFIMKGILLLRDCLALNKKFNVLRGDLYRFLRQETDPFSRADELKQLTQPMIEFFGKYSNYLKSASKFDGAGGDMHLNGPFVLTCSDLRNAFGSNFSTSPEIKIRYSFLSFKE